MKNLVTTFCLFCIICIVNACSSADNAQNECSDNSSCSGDTPYCETETGNCVACLSNDNCSGQTPRCDLTSHTCQAEAPPMAFYASFESGTIHADVGNEFAQQQTAGSNDNLDFFHVVDNPNPSQINASGKVLLISINVPDYSTRAEYHTSQMETVEKTYIYTWKELFPTNFGEGIDNVWNGYGVGQWKTWPCEVCGDHAEYICGGCGGIFNDRFLTVDDETFEFRFRAEPDCDSYYTPMEEGVWHAFALEIYWTNTEKDGIYEGYYNLYQDGELIHGASKVKTLFDNFIPGTYATGGCNMNWGMGLYMSWLGSDSGSLDYYLDDMAVFDVADGVTIKQVLAWQGI